MIEDQLWLGHPQSGGYAKKGRRKDKQQNTKAGGNRNQERERKREHFDRGSVCERVGALIRVTARKRMCMRACVVRERESL